MELIGSCTCGTPNAKPPCSFCTRGFEPGRLVFFDNGHDSDDYGVVGREGRQLTVYWLDGHSDPIDDNGWCEDLGQEVIATAEVLTDADYVEWMLHWHETWQDGEGSAPERPNSGMCDLIKRIEARYD